MKRLFGRNKQANTKSYDPEVMIPAIRCSICTGEQVAGFRDRVPGEFHELYVIRNEADIDAYVESIRSQLKQYLQGSDGIKLN